MQKQYRFEIFRQTRRRFAWRFVVDDKGRRRVLARSARDYRSREKARNAIIASRRKGECRSARRTASARAALKIVASTDGPCPKAMT